MVADLPVRCDSGPFVQSSGCAAFELEASHGPEDDVHAAVRQNGWVQTSFLVAATIVGTGVLEISGEFAVLGFIGGISTFLLFSPYNYLTGYLLNEIHLQYPTCMTLGDAAATIVGPNFGKITSVLVYTNIFFTLGNYSVPLSTAVQQIFCFSDMCMWTACCVAAVILLPFLQLRTLSGLALLSGISFATILVVLGISSTYLLASDTYECARQAVPEVSFSSFSNALGGFIFAFSGQSIFLEMNAEMTEPRHFTRSLSLSYAVMLVVYMFISVVAFSQCGRHTPEDYIILGIPKGPILQFVGFLMLVHVIISYAINSQVLTRGILTKFGLVHGLQNNLHGRVVWGGMTTLILASAQVLANLIPNFGTFCAFISAFLIAPLCFVVPCILYLTLDAEKAPDKRAGLMLRAACWAVLLSSAVYWIIGTVFAIEEILNSSAVMQCNLYETAGGHRVR